MSRLLKVSAIVPIIALGVILLADGCASTPTVRQDAWQAQFRDTSLGELRRMDLARVPKAPVSADKLARAAELGARDASRDVQSGTLQLLACGSPAASRVRYAELLAADGIGFRQIVRCCTSPIFEAYIDSYNAVAAGAIEQRQGAGYLEGARLQAERQTSR